MPPESSSMMYFSASRPNSFTASLGSTETSVLARLVVLLLLPVLVAGACLANALFAGANASAPEARMNSAVAAQIRPVMFAGNGAQSAGTDLFSYACYMYTRLCLRSHLTSHLDLIESCSGAVVRALSQTSQTGRGTGSTMYFYMYVPR